jgi:hypothetical protein
MKLPKPSPLIFFVVLGVFLAVYVWANPANEGLLGVGLQINYEDGTSKVIDPKPSPLSFLGLPMKIVDSQGKPFLAWIG